MNRQPAITDHNAHFTSRAQKYREAARLLRLAAEIMNFALDNDVLQISKELEEFADIIERLQFDE